MIFWFEILLFLIVSLSVFYDQESLKNIKLDNLYKNFNTMFDVQRVFDKSCYRLYILFLQFISKLMILLLGFKSWCFRISLREV